MCEYMTASILHIFFLFLFFFFGKQLRLPQLRGLKLRVVSGVHTRTCCFVTRIHLGQKKNYAVKNWNLVLFYQWTVGMKLMSVSVINMQTYKKETLRTLIFYNYNFLNIVALMVKFLRSSFVVSFSNVGSVVHTLLLTI